jgi:sulfopyruvate decarboxylase subunit beta
MRTPMEPAGRMLLRDAVAVIRNCRRDDDVVVSSMGNAREWMALGALHARDLVLVPSAMGHATSIGLGIALAQPDRRVIVLSGDGSLLMNLGTLVTISAEAPHNLVVVVYDNGVYEVTGAQPTPGTAAARADRTNIDFTAIARACGLSTIYRFVELSTWQQRVMEVLERQGPTFVVLDVEPVLGQPGPKSPGPAGQRARAFMQVLRHPKGRPDRSR